MTETTATLRPPHSSAERAAVTVPVFTAATALSAALMFMVQPMAGKMLLPLVGGTPAGWVVAVAFFQIMLLAGYALAHLISRLSPRAHAAAYLAALAGGAAFLPAHLDPALAASPGATGVFLTLLAALGMPAIALSMTASTLQRMFAHASAREPYFLYAASNAGSLAGLLLYPLLVEPTLTLPQQAAMWQAAYAVLGLIGLTCLWLCPAGRGQMTDAAPVKNAPRVFILSFLPSALLLAVTTQITTDIFPAPMIWVVPLALYLLTFIVAFSRARIVPQRLADTLQSPAIAVALFMLMAFNANVRGAWLALLVQLLAFTATALACHLRLADARPAETDRNMTKFYFLIAAGGATGGALNAFVFPVVFDRLLEYPTLLLCACLLHPDFMARLTRLQCGLFGLSLGGICVYATLVMTGLAPAAHATEICDGLLFALILLSSLNPRILAVTGLLLLVFLESLYPHEHVITARNFFGIVRVFDRPMEIKGERLTARYMYHGTTTHGYQILDPRYETTPTTYFTQNGPIGEVFAMHGPKKTLVVGLGTGTLACYGSGMTFIEIDPIVVSAAREKFSYLSKCGNPRIITGDGRLEMRGMTEKYDLIILDAFSSDAVPIHLITTNAIEEYLPHLNAKGLLLFNVTNRYFNLAPQLAANARALGLKHRVRLDAEPALPYATSSMWVAIGRQSAEFTGLSELGWNEIEPPQALRPWTDDYTNLLSALEF